MAGGDDLVRVTYTGAGPHAAIHGNCFRGADNVTINIGQTVTLPRSIVYRLLRDHPDDFVTSEAIPEEGDSYSVWTAIDINRLRKPDAARSVGIILTTFNGIELTARCVHSLAPVDNVDLRLYVVDNCSTDGTREWLDRNRIGYEQPIGRCGVAAALNAGRRHFLESERPPDYMLVLNNDVAISAEYIRELVAFMEATPKAGWSVGLWRAFLRMGTWPKITTHGLNFIDTSAHADTKIRYPGEPENIDLFLEVGDASATLLRTEAVVQVGPWDETFQPRYGEDEDLLTRFALAGWEAWRLPLAYDGIMSGYLTCNALSETQHQTGQRAYERYIKKWGDAPKSASKYVAQFAPVLVHGGKPLACHTFDPNRLQDIQPPLERTSSKTAAIVQHGHIGDILLSFPMARELKRAGAERVVWYAVPPYVDIAKLCPEVDEVIDTSQIRLDVPREGASHPFERASIPGRTDAEAKGYHPIVLAQIAPESQGEYLSESTKYGYVPFMYARNGFRPRSYRPMILGEPIDVDHNREAALADAGCNLNATAPRILLNLACESIPVQIDYGYWSKWVRELRQRLPDVEVVHNEQGHRYNWQGDVEVLRHKPYADIRCVAYMARGFDLIVSVSSAPLWSAFIHDKPAICLLPRQAMGALPRNKVIELNSMQRCGLQREWSVMDAVIDDHGGLERIHPADLADICAAALAGADLRGIHSETYADLFRER